MNTLHSMEIKLKISKKKQIFIKHPFFLQFNFGIVTDFVEQLPQKTSPQLRQ